MLDALPIGIYACDIDGHILRVNREAIRLWGQAPRLLDPTERFCGSYRLESLDGQLIPREETPMARAVRYGESFDGAEAVVHNPDGRRWIARVNIAPLRDAGGVVVGAINCFQDVSREHEMRSALERHQRTFDSAMVVLPRVSPWNVGCDARLNAAVGNEVAAGLEPACGAGKLARAVLHVAGATKGPPRRSLITASQ